VLQAGFVSHRLTDPLSSIPESGKGRGELAFLINEKTAPSKGDGLYTSSTIVLGMKVLIRFWFECY